MFKIPSSIYQVRFSRPHLSISGRYGAPSRRSYMRKSTVPPFTFVKFPSAVLVLGPGGFRAGGFRSKRRTDASTTTEDNRRTARNGHFFPPRMRSYPLYGDCPTEFKASPDEESNGGRGFIQKVSRPHIQVYLPAKSSYRTHSRRCGSPACTPGSGIWIRPVSARSDFRPVGIWPPRWRLRPDFLILVYLVISMDAKITHVDSRKVLLGADPSEDHVRLFSNELHVTKDAPPTLMLHAADDRRVDVDNSVAFWSTATRRSTR